MSSALVEAAASKAVAQWKQPTARELIQAQQTDIEMQQAGATNSSAFVRAAISSVQSSPQLQQATPTSLLGGIIPAAQIKLEIGQALWHFHLTPRHVSKKVGDQWGKQWTCLPIIGYQGCIEFACGPAVSRRLKTSWSAGATSSTTARTVSVAARLQLPRTLRS